MKILFDIRIGSGARTPKGSLNVQSFWTMKGKKTRNRIVTIEGMPEREVKAILEEYEKSQSLTGANLKNLNFFLLQKSTSAKALNSECVEI